MYFNSPVAPFYKAFLAAAACFILGMLAIISALPWLGMLSSFDGAETLGSNLESIGLQGILLAAILMLVPATIIYRAMVRNTVYNHTVLGDGHRFHSDVSPLRMLWIAVSNAAIVVLTLGLMLPWAKVRRVRYLTHHTRFIPAGSLDEFVGGVTADVSAIGDAYGDIEGFDIGFGA